MLLMMMLILSYSKSWCQISTSPTGGRTDSVLISIDYIKLANKKLIEGISCKKIVVLQDSVINLQSKKYAELEAEVSILQTKLYDVRSCNVKLTKDVDSQKSKVRFLGGTALASTLAFLVCIILK